MKKRYFIAGTDTDAGKTYVANALLKEAAKQGLSTLGLKPVAAGSELFDGREANDDALALQSASTVKPSYDLVNPVLLKRPMAPHLAAEDEGKRITVQTLAGYCRGAWMSAPAEFTLIEGAGGWRVPLNARESLAGLAIELQLEVILVVGMKLGCLNHALLTAETIARDGCKLAGWVANTIDHDMLELERNIQSLQARLPAPLLGVMPRQADHDELPENWVNPKLFQS